MECRSTLEPVKADGLRGKLPFLQPSMNGEYADPIWITGKKFPSPPAKGVGHGVSLRVFANTGRALAATVGL